MPYIYEMDVALLRIQYVLPTNFHVLELSTVMHNDHPYDRSNIRIYYQAAIQEAFMRYADGMIIMDSAETPLPGKIIKVLIGENLEDLVNQCRIWSIIYSNEQQSVNKMTNS
jgi:hypothetical protein